MRNIIPILFSLFAAACGGEQFTSAEFDTIGGGGEYTEAGSDSAGSPAAGRGGTAHGGSPGAGGSSASGGATASAGSAGKPAAGGAAAGSGSAGAPAGGVSATCDLDEAKLTAALPKSFVWQDFMFTNGEFCVTCRDTPCDTVNVISWGVPVAGEVEGEYFYNPNADSPMVPVELGANDGSCTSEKSCGVKLYLSTVQLTVERSGAGWVIAGATVSALGENNACLSMYPSGSNTAYASGADFGKDAAVNIRGLQIPCN